MKLKNCLIFFFFARFLILCISKHGLVEAPAFSYLTSSSLSLPIVSNADRLNKGSLKSKRSHTMGVEDRSSSFEKGQAAMRLGLWNVGITQYFWCGISKYQSQIKSNNSPLSSMLSLMKQRDALCWLAAIILSSNLPLGYLPCAHPAKSSRLHHLWEEL